MRVTPPQRPIARFQNVKPVTAVYVRPAGYSHVSVLDTIKQAVGLGDSGVESTVYECTECNNTFESAKDPRRAQCMECMSTAVEPANAD